MDAEQIIVNGCTINWCNWLVYYDNEDGDVAAQMMMHLCHGGAGWLAPQTIGVHSHIQFAWPLVSHLIIIKIPIPLNPPIKPLQRVFAFLILQRLLGLDRWFYECTCT